MKFKNNMTNLYKLKKFIKIMIKRIILIVLIVLMSFNFVNSFNQDSFGYIGIYQDTLTNTYKVHYELKNFEDNKYFFELIVFFNGEKIDDKCAKEISIREGDSKIFQKITCSVEDMGEGEYTFDVTLFDEDKNMLENVISKEYVFLKTQTNMKFIENGNKTTILIDIDSIDNESVTVFNRIPKSVIEILNDDNKNSLIESNIEYEILEEDPLIAWNIEEPPKTINYTVNKKITKEEQKQFSLDVKESKTFQYLKFTLFVLILLIMGLLFKPVLKKK